MTRAWLAISVLLAAPTAVAQAPGEIAPAPAAAAPDPVMARSWAVGLGLGGMSITGVGQHQTELGLVELALRYRTTRHLELELRVGAGDSKDGGKTMPADQIRYGELDLRYRFAPGHAWDGWLEGGIGAFGDVPEDGKLHVPADEESQRAERGLLELGLGVERRFGAFAIDAALRAYAFGANPAGSPPPGPGMAPPPITFDPPTSAGELTVGGSYDF